MKRVLMILGLALMALSGPMTAEAQPTYTWVGGNGNWSSNSNWDMGHPPTSNGTAIITNSGTAQVSDPSCVCQKLKLGVAAGQRGDLRILDNGILTCSMGKAIIGCNGEGSVLHDGGGHTTDTLWIGRSVGGEGSYEMKAGHLTCYSRLIVGREGKGTFTQSEQGGVVEVDGKVILGEGSDGEGRYYLYSGSLSASAIEIGLMGRECRFEMYAGPTSLDANLIKVGTEGVMRVDSLSGPWNHDGRLVVDGGSLGSDGTVRLHNGGSADLSEGELGTGPFYVSSSGDSSFVTQTGGFCLSQRLCLGEGPGESGTYNIEEGTLQTQELQEFVGYDGIGTFHQNGGTHVCDSWMYLGYNPGSRGEYYLDDGELNVYRLIVGKSGTGLLYVDRGEIKGRFPGDYPKIRLGGSEGSEGTLTVTGNCLINASTLRVGQGGQGTLNLDYVGAEIHVSEKFVVGLDSDLNAVTGSMIFMESAYFENESINPDRTTGLQNLTLVFEEGSEPQSVEVGCRDFGPYSGITGFIGNHSLNALAVGAADEFGSVRLVDDYDNQPDWDGAEVFYVKHLEFGPDSHVDLNGKTLYYIDAYIDPGATIEYNGGQLIQVDPTRADHNVGNCVLTMTSQGTLGFVDYQAGEGAGFIYPADGVNTLWVGSLWVGESPTYVANRDYANDPAKEWVVVEPEGYALVEVPGDDSDQDIYAVYTDADAVQPRGLRVEQESWAYAAPDTDDDFVIVRYTIRNEGGQTLNDLYVGEFLDLIMTAPYYNRGGTDIPRNLIYNSDDTGLHVGVRILDVAGEEAPVANLTLIHNETYVWPNGYILDEDKYGFLSASEPEYIVHEAPDLDDYGIVASVGPISLDPGEERLVAFAIVGGESLNELKENSDAAQLIANPSSDTPEMGAPTIEATRLLPNAPNPFRQRTVIRFDLAERANVDLGIYDVAGRLVRGLVTDKRPAGHHTLVWDSRDDSGRAVSAGIYFLRLEVGGTKESWRLMRIR